MARVPVHKVRAEKIEEDGNTRFEWWCGEEDCDYHAVQPEGGAFRVVEEGSPLVHHTLLGYRPSKDEVK